MYQILAQSDNNVKDFYAKSKIFDYCAILISICPVDFDENIQNNNYLINITLFAIKILKFLITGNDEVLLKLAVCVL